MKKINKRVVGIPALVLFFVIMSGAAHSYYYSITPICQNGTCIEGQDAKWEVLITNDGNHDVRFTAVELADAINNSVFAAEKRDYFPQRDYQGDLIYVMQKKSAKINISGKVPAANAKNANIYYPCFTLAIYDFYTIARDDKYEERQCFAQNETMQMFQCIGNDNCAESQVCSENRCKSLKCKNCQYIVNHKCINYQCCESSQCSLHESCLNNTCVSLGCEYNQYYFNHTCNTLDCAADEYIENMSCKKLSCGFEEFAFNHTCMPLECGYDEFIINHTCRKLNCMEDEAIKNHLCIPLDCAEDKMIYNHTCQKLNCRFFQDIINHGCVNNKSAVTKLLLEAIAVIAILAFLLLDFSKFEKMHLKKNIPENSKQASKEKVVSENEKKDEQQAIQEPVIQEKKTESADALKAPDAPKDGKEKEDISGKAKPENEKPEIQAK